MAPAVTGAPHRAAPRRASSPALATRRLGSSRPSAAPISRAEDPRRGFEHGSFTLFCPYMAETGMNRSRAYWTLAPPARCSPSPASPAPPKGHDSTKVNRRGRRLGRRAAPWARGGATAWALARAKSRYHGEVIRCRGASLQADPPALQPPTPPPYNTSLVLWPRHTATAYPSLLAHRALEAFFVATGQMTLHETGR